jgi:hypothetical protein
VNETQKSTLSGCKYDVANHEIMFVLPKTTVNNATAGTHLTKVWAAVWNKNFGETTRRLEDRGPNSGYGLDYIIRGTAGGEIVDVKITADNGTAVCKPGDPGTYKLAIYNAGTGTVSVDILNTTMTKGWSVDFTPPNMTLLTNRTIIVTVNVYCPRDVKNGTNEGISVYGNIHNGNQTTRTNSVYLLTTVNYIPPTPPPVSWWSNISKWLTKTSYWQFYVIWGVVIAVIVAGTARVALRRIRRRKAEIPVTQAAPAPVK